MLRGFDSNNVSDSSDTKMVFFSEFLCAKHTCAFAISTDVFSIIWLFLASVCICISVLFDCVGKIKYDDAEIVFGLGGAIFFVCFLLSVIRSVWNYGMIMRIFKISSVDDISNCRIIKNRKDKYGLCAPGRIRKKSIRILKRMKYDEIVRVSDCSYVFRKKDVYGVYNSSMKKFIVPFECDYISTAPDGNGLVVIKDNETMRYSFEGFRCF